MDLLTFDIIEIILLSVTGAFFIIQVFYYLGLYNNLHRLNRAVKKDKIPFSTQYPPISVIICARNESENLLRNLPSVLNQDYPNFEVIVINDGSTDESEEVLSNFEKSYSNLYHSFTPDGARYISRKKLALTVGIKASKYDWLMFTEANCQPASKDWLKLMARNFSEHTQIVLGYSGYEQGKGWLQRKIAFSNLFSSLRYLGYAIADKPYMGIGRNMAYRKELFVKYKGFSSHLNMQRGDDDLFINEAATPINTKVELSADATTRMEPIERYKTWKEEQVSYIATSRFYKGTQKYFLGFETLSRIGFIAVTIATIIYAAIVQQWLVLGCAILIYLLRYIMQMIIINRTSKDLNEKKYIFTLPIFDITLALDSLKFRIYRRFRGKGDFMRR